MATSDRLRIAITSSGAAQFSTRDDIATWLDQQETQEAALHALPELIRALRAAMREASRRPDFVAFAGDIPCFSQYFIAIWSLDRRQPEAYIIGTDQGFFPSQVRPLQLFPVGAYVAPDVAAAWKPRIDGGPDPAFEPARNGLDMIKEQRFVVDNEGNYVVGGCAELTTVSESGVSVELLHAWPDRINKPIRHGWVERWGRWARHHR
ncbi:MAG: hypothetical protein KDJ36_18590 [Hyphomicrobiaceae bacterium]|nr:hypothetical protein [Hyphomicrobiaceae bacterium]